jgi:hypothetical protein
MQGSMQKKKPCRPPPTIKMMYYRSIPVFLIGHSITESAFFPGRVMEEGQNIEGGIFVGWDI